MSWNEERVQELTRLWDAGQSASQIGKALGMSKNAVIGKAHRLKLPPRPSPIRAGGAGPRPPRRTMPRPVMRKRPAGAAGAAGDAPGDAPGDAAGRAELAAGRSVLDQVELVRQVARKLAPERPARAVRKRGDSRACLWPIGDPGDADFHFCGGEAEPGKPYCASHCAKAYIVKSRQGSEAA
jgi:GcrA cell cycle regulator